MRPEPCPFCRLPGGFHDDEIHASRPVDPPEKLLPPPEDVPMCRACDLPLAGPGAPGCRYPNHTA